MPQNQVYRFHIGLHATGEFNNPQAVAHRKAAAIRIMREYIPDGFTVTDTTGYWNDTIEPSLVVEAITAQTLPAGVICHQLCTQLHQECVFVTTSAVETAWIKAQ
ncbi:MAG: hypothetical protein IMZ61_10900 [Planctomycetes bacterium]|nr:hypothetical protein [Planctomycetota bacterium]